MAEDNGISDQLNQGSQCLTDPSAKLAPLPVDNKSDVRDSTENEAGTAATSPSHCQGESSNQESPEPSCSICLGKIFNKAFTNNCCHMFCFTCLLEWSKVRAVCPLCKTRFESILHNIRTDNDYDQYYIPQTSPDIPWAMSDFFNSFRYSTLMQQLSYNRARRSIRLLGAEDEQDTPAPDSDQLASRPIIHDLSRPYLSNIRFRQRVYAENLWAQRRPIRSRISPAYYRANQASTDRFLPWLSRDLIVLLAGEQRVGVILDFVMSLIFRFDILSQEFFHQIEPIIGTNTSHFVHEFYCFAISSLELAHYDAQTLYGSHSEAMNWPEVDMTSVHDSDDHPLDMSMSPGMDSPGPSSGQSGSSRYMRRNRQKPQATVVLKKNRTNNVYKILKPRHRHSPISSSSASLPRDLTLPSSSRAFTDVFASTSTNEVPTSTLTNEVPASTSINDAPCSTPSVISLSSGEESDCLIVGEVKPRWMRTPEVIELPSSPDSEVERPLTPPFPDPPCSPESDMECPPTPRFSDVPSSPESGEPLKPRFLDFLHGSDSELERPLTPPLPDFPPGAEPELELDFLSDSESELELPLTPRLPDLEPEIMNDCSVCLF